MAYRTINLNYIINSILIKLSLFYDFNKNKYSKSLFIKISFHYNLS